MMPSPDPSPRSPPLAKGAVFGVLVLTLVNLFNYIDRFILAALLPDIELELGLSHFQAGLLATAFILVYALASPLFGFVGDRGVRTRWLSLGVGLWSFATGLAGLARSFAALFVARAAVGIGEAAYGTIAPAMLADYVPPRHRGRAMAIFFLAIPVGSALGYILGGVGGTRLGWRATFLLVGLPGLLLALFLWRLREPVRGHFDDAATRGRVPLADAYRELVKNRVYVWTVLGYAAYTFAIGGLANWMPSYVRDERGCSAEQGMLIFGGITVVAGIIGTLVGGALGDKLQSRSANGYAWLSVGAMLVGSVLALLSLLAPDITAFWILLGLGELFLFANTGPVNALIVGVVRPGVRATASATAILVIHVLGDAISPPLIGKLADATSLGEAMLVVPVFFMLAGALWLKSRRG